MTQETALLERTEEVIAFVRVLQGERDKALAELTIAKGERDEMGAILAQVESKVDEMLAAVSIPADQQLQPTVAVVEPNPEAPTEQAGQELEECREALEQTRADLEQAKDQLRQAEYKIRMQASKTRRQNPQMSKEDWEALAKTGQRNQGEFMREIREKASFHLSRIELLASPSMPLSKNLFPAVIQTVVIQTISPS